MLELLKLLECQGTEFRNDGISGIIVKSRQRVFVCWDIEAENSGFIRILRQRVPEW